MRYTDIDRQIEALAATQHGAFRQQQAFTMGVSDRYVRRRLAQGNWRRPAPGVLVLASSAGTWRRQCKIAELSVDESAVAGHVAAALHELTGFRARPDRAGRSLHASCRQRVAVVLRYAGAKLTTIDGIRVTTVAQTLFDLAGRVGLRRLERAVDDALAGRQLSVADLVERLDFYVMTRRPGLPRMRALVGERSEDGWVPVESELEAVLVRVMRRLPGAPTLVRQAASPWRSERPGRVLLAAPRPPLDHRGGWPPLAHSGRRLRSAIAGATTRRQRMAIGVMRFTWVHLHDLADDALDLIQRTIAVDPAA